MKSLIVICSAIIVWVLYNYSDYEDKASIIILVNGAIICFAGAKLYSDKHFKKDDYESAEKEMDELLAFDGIFRYSNEGFYMKRKKVEEFIKWKEILEINSFNIYVASGNRQSGIEIITGKERIEFINGYTLGIEKLTEEFYNYLPMNEKTKTLKINNFGLEKTNLYLKK